MTTITEMQVTELHGVTMTGRRFRIVAEPEHPEWQKMRRPENEPWCELTVSEERTTSGTPTGALLVTSFGGEEWPSAWPRLFRNVGRNRVEVTDEGREVLGLA